MLTPPVHRALSYLNLALSQSEIETTHSCPCPCSFRVHTAANHVTLLRVRSVTSRGRLFRAALWRNHDEQHAVPRHFLGARPLPAPHVGLFQRSHRHSDHHVRCGRARGLSHHVPSLDRRSRPLAVSPLVGLSYTSRHVLGLDVSLENESRGVYTIPLRPRFEGEPVVE